MIEGGESMIKKKNFFLKLFTFRTLKILWFICFRFKKHMYCQIRLGLLYCFAVLFIVISVSNISPRIQDNNEKKSHGRRNETTLYLRLKTCWKFPQKREHQTSTSLRGSFLFRGSREKSRESNTRKETRVRGAGWQACLLATSFAFSQAKFQQLSSALFIFMTISIDRGTLTLFAVYNLYWLLLLYFHFHSDLERSEIIASNKSLNQRGSSWI